MSDVTQTLQISMFDFILGILILIVGQFYVRKYSKNLKAEESLEKMERSVPLILSRIVELAGSVNFYTLLYRVSTGNKNILARWIRKLISIYQSNPSVPLNFLLRKAILENFSQSALMMMFYSVLEMVRVIGDQAVDIIQNIAELSQTIISHTDKIKTRLNDSVKMISIVTTLLIPFASAFAIVFFGGVNSILFKTGSALQGLTSVGGMGGTGMSMGFGLTPLSYPMHLVTIILTLHVAVTVGIMTLLQMQLSGKYYARKLLVATIIKRVGVGLTVFGIGVYTIINLFGLLFTF